MPADTPQQRAALTLQPTILSHPTTATQAGDICKDYGESWRGLYLGPCEANTFCRAYKRGVFKCVYNDGVKVPGTNLPGVMSIGTECYDEDKVNNDEKQKTKTAPGRAEEAILYGVRLLLHWRQAMVAL